MEKDYLGSELARLQAIIDGTGAGTWEWNAQTGETRFNEAWAAMFGYQLAELQPISIATWRAVCHPDDLAHSDAQLAAYFAGNIDTYSCDLRVRHKDGSWRWIRDSGRIATRTATGEVEWVSGAHFDITELKDNEQRLATNKARIRAILDSLPAAVYTQTSQPGRDYTYISEQIIHVLGDTPEQWLASSNASKWQRVHDSDHADLRDRVQRWLKQGAVGDLLAQYRMRHVDGHFVMVQDRLRAQRDERGNVIEYVGSLTDISAENEVSQRLDKLAKSVHGVLYQFEMRTDGHMRFPFASEGIQRIYGVTPEAVLEDAGLVFKAIHPDDLVMVSDSITESARQLAPWALEYRVLLAGDVRWVYGHAVPERDTDGNVLWHGLLVDITDRKTTEIALQRSQGQLLAAQEIAQLGYWELSLADQSLQWSDLVYRIVGVDKSQFKPSPQAFRQCVHPDDWALIEAAKEQAIDAGIHATEFRIIWPNNEVRWVREWASKRRLADGTDVITGTIQDITERKELELTLRNQSITDALTGLYNRRYFVEVLEHHFKRSQRQSASARCCVISADLDFFKRINDTYGHLIGDVVLRTVSDILREQVRSSDVVARTGGEEFALFLPRTSLADAEQLAERIRVAVSAHRFNFDGATTSITVTLGVSQFAPSDQSYEEVLIRVDRALYQGKERGRNQVVVIV